MTSSSTATLDVDRELVGRMLARIAVSLFVVFGAVVIATSLPVRLLDPAWQLRFAASLVNNGTIAIVGFVLMWLAGILNPGSGRLRARRDRIASLACAAAIGYLLLIPLQAYAAWQGVSRASTSQNQQLRAATTRIQQYRQAVKQAGSTAELQARLQSLRGPTLPASDLARPIEAVRPQVLAGLETAESTVRQRLGGLPPDRLWQLVQESLRVGLSSLAYAFAFASGAYLPGQPLSLLDGWSEGLRNSRRRSQSRAKSSGRRTISSNAEYLREISRDSSSSSERKQRNSGWEQDEDA